MENALVVEMLYFGYKDRHTMVENHTCDIVFNFTRHNCIFILKIWNRFCTLLKTCKLTKKRDGSSAATSFGVNLHLFSYCSNSLVVHINND